MQARLPLICGILFASVFAATPGSAQMSPLPGMHNLKGQGFAGIYGTYAPHGDCQRDPQITIDDSGFTFRYSHQQQHPSTFVYQASFYGGAGGSSEEDLNQFAFLPFPSGVTEGQGGPEVSDWGPVNMEIDGDRSTITLEGIGHTRPNSFQAALIQHSPYARCGAQGAASHATALSSETAPAYPMKLGFGAAAPKPTPAQNAAIRRAAAADIKEFNHPEQGGYVVAQADLNDDGRPDLLVQYDDMAFCGSRGCSGVIVMATADGYSTHAIGLPNFYGEIDILAATHGGMHDLRFGDSPVWSWNGSEYAVDRGGSRAAATTAPAPQPAAGGPGWQTREVAGLAMAMAVATDSVIKTLSVFCNAGKPVLAMLVKARPPAGPVMLTFEFNGGAVNVPMGQGNGEATLWLSDLSRSDLPQRLTREGGTVPLRINGGNQGEVSLNNSTATTQAALKSCYAF